MTPRTQTLRDAIAEAVYDDGRLMDRGLASWGGLSEVKRAGWLEDADRVLAAHRRFHEEEKLRQAEVEEFCKSEDGDEMCRNCDCWKLTRAYCS